MSDTQSSNVHVRCRQCGTIALMEEIYCFSCGRRLIYVCHVCGHEHGHLVAQYCPHCGNAVELPQDIEPGEESQPTDENR